MKKGCGAPMRAVFAMLLGTIAALLVSPPALAHTMGAPGGSWLSGFVHPFTGLDHFLAMVAVGIWAAQIGGRAMWLLPVAFPMVMAVGGVGGATGLPLPFVELFVTASVVVLGLTILLRVRPPLEIAVGGVSVLAVFHGYAHGVELPASANPLAYGFGFVVATTTLHVLGLGIGQLEEIRFGERVLRAIGASLAVTGVLLLATL